MHHSQFTILHCTIKILDYFITVPHCPIMVIICAFPVVPCSTTVIPLSTTLHCLTIMSNFPSQYLIFHQIFCWPISVSLFPSICTIFSSQCTSVPHSGSLCHHDVLMSHYISHCPTVPNCIIPMLHCSSILLCFTMILHSSTTKPYCPLTMPYFSFIM